MELDANGLEVLDRGACLRLLSTVPIGRIGLSAGALPVVLPVNFVLWNEEVVVRTGSGGKLNAALVNSVVAFEADHYDGLSHTGWSVLLQGSSREITDPLEIEAVRRLPLRPWVEPGKDRFISIAADLVSGRRVRGWHRFDGHESFVSLARAH